MRDEPMDRLPNAATLTAGVVAVALSILGAVAWKLSLDWPSIRDLPIMLYTALLWDRYGIVPHAGFFDMTLVGSYLSFLAIGKTFGYDATAVRWADLGCYLAIACLTIFAMRRAGWLTGWVAAALFGLAYLQSGPSISLQREYLMLIPVVAATTAATLATPLRWHLPTLACGLGIGAAMTIKPQAIVAAAPLAAYLTTVAWHGRFGVAARGHAALAVVGWMSAGAGAVVAAMLALLAGLGALSAFVDIALHYLPLYSALSGTHELIPAGERLGHLLTHGSRFGRHYDWLLAGVAGAGAFALAHRPGDPERRHAALFVGLAAAFAVYPSLAGKFWTYHWLPMVYWLVVCASLAAGAAGGKRRALIGWAAFAAFAGLLLLKFPPGRAFGSLLEAPDVRPVTAEQIGDFLNERLLPGDTVQPMDWTKGAVVHGLLLAEAELATSFIYDFHFYHHVSNPYIRALRQRFLSELEAASPRYIVRSRVGPFPTGPDTNRKFEGFRRLLKERYRKVVDTRAYAIFELRPEYAGEAGDPTASAASARSIQAEAEQRQPAR
jgi:hypothetical protein